MLENFNRVLGIIPEKAEEASPKVQELVSLREAARQVKDFARSDELREQIKNLGYEVDDTAYGPLVKPLK